MNERTARTQTHDYSKNAGYRDQRHLARHRAHNARIFNGDALVIYNAEEYGFTPADGKRWLIVIEPSGRIFTTAQTLRLAKKIMTATACVLNEPVTVPELALRSAYTPGDFVHVKPHYMKKPFWAWVVAAGADWVEVEHWSFGYVTRHDLDEVTLANDKAPTAEAPSA